MVVHLMIANAQSFHPLELALLETVRRGPQVLSLQIHAQRERGEGVKELVASRRTISCKWSIFTIHLLYSFLWEKQGGNRTK